jgi:glucose-fructose oxidoreductase
MLNDRSPEPSGNEGLADVRVITAIYESAKTGEAKRIEPVPKRRRPNQQMKIKRPPVEEPELVGASTPRST